MKQKGWMMLRRLRRFFSWDSRSATEPNMRGEDIRARGARDAGVSGRSSGTDTSYVSRFTR